MAKPVLPWAPHAILRDQTMKKIALAAALSLATTSAFAGGMAEPVMEPEVVAAKTSSSAGGIIVPLLLLLVVAAAIAGSNGGSEPANF
jgi:FtsH-binding integral membrane protein